MKYKVRVFLKGGSQFDMWVKDLSLFQTKVEWVNFGMPRIMSLDPDEIACVIVLKEKALRSRSRD